MTADVGELQQLRDRVIDLEEDLGREQHMRRAAEERSATLQAEAQDWSQVMAGISGVLGEWVVDADRLPAIIAARVGESA